ncbi:glycosyltransferase family 2 protein [Aliiroseovarius sp.]|uniref:glycosyltransferase family 2 protein n=1 Tax=Aliiroseovarius sp. TaxID=1872442 RepID=UPI00262187EC|nr:glycosyltransferase family 2 protein [Aliiroseovarius sp.]
MRALAVLCVRNEGAFLLEWLAHHKGVGFTEFLVFSNDCDDGTDAMLDRLEAMGELVHIRNDGPHEGGVQWAAMKRADRHPLVRNADWLMTLDIDEFVNIHVGDHTLAALIAALPEAEAITLTWRLFGNGGVERFVDAPVAEQFTRAAPEVMYWPWRAFMFKTLYRQTGAYRKLGVHRPRSPVDGKADRARWFDGHGRELEPRFRRQQIFSPFGRPHYGLAQLNHYALGAMESYILKRDRGRAVHGADSLGLDYWAERNWCQVEDSSIRAAHPLTHPHLQRLRADDTLSRLHAGAVAWRRIRFEALMRQEPFRALYGRLLMTPPARPVPLDRARELFRLANQNRAKPAD